MNNKKIIIPFFIAIIFGCFSFTSNILAQTNNPEIYFFYSETCPHCKTEGQFLNTLQEKYPEADIKRYEVVSNQENQKILKDFYEKYNVPKGEQGRVPVTFTPTKYFVGFSDQIGQQIESCLQECIGGTQSTSKNLIKIPFIGEVDLAKLSLPVLTVVFGTLDGFNPCAMWVLVVLVSLLLGLKDRKKIALVGGVFIFAEGFLYFLMMSAWLNAFIALSFVSFLRIAIGLFGIGFGIWRIRDFFTWNPGVCKVVDEKKSKKIIDKIKNILKPSAVPATVFGVITLAFSVNLVEFLCSAGFPTIYTRILTLQSIGQFQHYLYLLLYNFFYMLDDFVVFGVAFFTLKHFDFSDKYNRYSTLVAGLLLLILGVLLIFKPGLLMFS